MSAVSIKDILICSVLIFLVDLPWLSLTGGNYTAIVQAIQGGSVVRMRPLAGIVVYPALAYLALNTKSLKDSFLTGLAVYAVYDFTVLAIFKDYPLYMGVLDSLWGGVLFSTVFWLRERFGL